MKPRWKSIVEWAMWMVIAVVSAFRIADAINGAVPWVPWGVLAVIAFYGSTHFGSRAWREI